MQKLRSFPTDIDVGFCTGRQQAQPFPSAEVSSRTCKRGNLRLDVTPARTKPRPGLLAKGAGIALLTAVLASPAAAQLKREVVTVAVRPGVTMKYLEIRGSEPPRATVILFAGGNGVLGVGPSGEIGTDLSLNFLIRSRELFAGVGLAVAALDVASDLRGQGLNGDIRLSAQHAEDVARVIAALKTRIGAPVWVVGTSSGTISAAGVAARLAQSEPRPDGVVLTSTQTTLVPGLCGRTVYFASLGAIRVPVLAASHRDDGCPCSPGSAAAGATLIAALSGTTAKEHRIFTGGSPPQSKGPCLARTPHGFFRIESHVVQAIGDWIAKR
jgi:subtilisin family serine protease